MTALAAIDELYSAFCSTLPSDLRPLARALAHHLGLAPVDSIPWSEVFGHEVTLAAPAMVAQGMPDVAADLVANAVLAHMLAVIEAFGTDRIQDRQVQETTELRQLLERARLARNEALVRVAGQPVGPRHDPNLADAETLSAIRAERDCLLAGHPMAFERYESISLGKQAVGFPGSVALARAAGWDTERVLQLVDALGSIWLGLQMHDDVIDWEDDYARGGAWAVVLARGEAPASLLDGDAKALVLGTKVIARMLWRSREHFANAEQRFDSFGASRLASWARERKTYVENLARSEEQHAGFAVRAQALRPWAKELLA